jgi:F-type H+-transporting ATPase subunit delta
LAALEIIKLFIENHQLPRLYAFFRSFCTLIENKKNLLLGEFVTALPVPAAYLKQAETILSDRSGKPVSLKSKVDPKILGGFVIKLLNHKMIDASLRQNLASLKNCMSKEMQA